MQLGTKTSGNLKRRIEDDDSISCSSRERKFNNFLILCVNVCFALLPHILQVSIEKKN